MSVSYIITAELLSRFKEPFGLLIEGPPSETVNKLKKIIAKNETNQVISVGDIVTRNLQERKIIPFLSITDNKSMREKLPSLKVACKKVLYVKNPSGTITEEAIKIIQGALEKEEQTQIIVEGEEDLLTLVAVLYAPEGFLVVYGQPQKGIVVVKVTPEKRAEAKKLFDSMKLINEKKSRSRFDS